MKKTGKIPVVILSAALLMVGCAKKHSASSWSLDNSGASAQLKQFIAAQETQARALAKQDGNKLPSDFDAFYKAAETGDWQDATNLFQQMRKHLDGDSSLLGSWWSATLDAYGVFWTFPPGDKYAIAFGNDIIQSIPAGSIYFGGADPGRFVVTALMESHADGKPFFMLSQNPLADATYLHYLRAMYGRRIYLPTTNDVRNAFDDYMDDVKQRMKHDRRFSNEPRQVKAGENVHMSEDGRLQVSGQTAVMMINALIAKVIFDHNTNCEYYVEESFPLDWMYPYLSPHELIFKLNRSPLPSLTAEVLDQDHAFWTQKCQSMLGDWLKPGTSVTDVCAFARTVYVNKDLSHFRGDQRYVGNEYACKSFSKLRSSIGGVYAWRLGGQCPPEYRPKSEAEVQRLFAGQHAAIHQLDGQSVSRRLDAFDFKV